MIYKGWIPVASGYLSFTNIRGQIIPGRCPEPPVLTGPLDGNEIGICATRLLVDWPLAPIRTPFRGDQTYEFYCRARKVRGTEDALERLEGIVVAYPRCEKENAHELAGNDQTNVPTPGVYQDCLGWVVAFSLSRDGCVTLDWGKTTRKDFLEIVDIDESQLEQAETLLTFESFSFLKDLIHAHKFHSIDDDSIVVPYLIESEDDKSWMLDTAKNIHRAVISSIRNHPAQHGLTNALGKLAYLRAFLGVTKLDVSWNLESLEHTIQARLQREQTATDATDAIRNVTITILTASIATAITLFQLLQIPCIDGLGDSTGCRTSFVVPGTVLTLTGTLLENWTWFAICLFSGLLVMGYLVSRRSILELYSQRTGNERWDWHIVRFVYGLALTRGRYMVICWLTILTLAILLLVYFAVSSLIRH